MWAVSDAFLDALHFPQKRVTRATYQVPGGVEVPLRVKGGTVKMDDSARYRRTASLSLFGSTADYEKVMTPGTLFRISHGLNMGTTSELVPVFCGEVSSGNQTLGGNRGDITIPLVDRAVWLGRSDFTIPFTPTSVTRAAAISQAVAAAIPGVVIITTSTDVGDLGNGKLWTGSRLDAISQLAADAAAESFFLPDGTYLIRNQPSISEKVSWTLRGLVKGGERARPQDRLYNTVIVTPTASDGSQTWTQQTAQITDPLSPRHPSKVGIVPYFLPSATATSADTALTAARARLSRIQGNTDSLSLDTISNPALEGGDVIRLIIPKTGDEPAQIFQHIVDGFSMDLVTGAMRLSTRSQSEAIA